MWKSSTDKDEENNFCEEEKHCNLLGEKGCDCKGDNKCKLKVSIFK